ncbi:hypothetical protein NDU88_009385 [Pleurodeles waltl]|uniref:Uncharacterized protein n=1 Tax=Pleurodeles waltl TaxID=8319 RepID=A0AAV7RY80_PLEWA|nr:hypothetical protein NDU88_009385 [Pleurodeles waltl]
MADMRPPALLRRKRRQQVDIDTVRAGGCGKESASSWYRHLSEWRHYRRVKSEDYSNKAEQRYCKILIFILAESSC